jgi:hypothetical protein
MGLKMIYKLDIEIITEIQSIKTNQRDLENQITGLVRGEAIRLKLKGNVKYDQNKFEFSTEDKIEG